MLRPQRPIDNDWLKQIDEEFSMPDGSVESEFELVNVKTQSAHLHPMHRFDSRLAPGHRRVIVSDDLFVLCFRVFHATLLPAEDLSKVLNDMPIQLVISRDLNGLDAPYGVPDIFDEMPRLHFHVAQWTRKNALSSAVADEIFDTWFHIQVIAERPVGILEE